MDDVKRVYTVSLGFEAEENVTKAIDKIERGLRKLDTKNAELIRSFDKVYAGFSDISSAAQEAKKSAESFFSAPSKESFSGAVSSVKKAVADYKKEIEALNELKSKFEQQGGNTKGIERAIKDTTRDLESLSDTLDSLVENRLTKLANEFNNAADAADKDRIKFEAVNEIMSELGVTSEDAEGAFQSFVDILLQGGESLGEAAAKGQGFKAALSKIGGAIAGNQGLMKVLGGLVKGVGGFAAIIGGKVIQAAMNLFTSYIRKQVKALADWVKSWGEFRRALREGVGDAVASASSELRKLDELNEKLSTATKYSAEYNKARSEIIRQYGQYNQYLDSEIRRVGDLSSVYEQLRGAIIQAAVAKQQEKLISEQENKWGEKISHDAEKMLIKYQRKFGNERGLEAFQSWRDSMLLGTEMSEDAMWGAGKVKSHSMARHQRKLSKKIGRINAVLSPTETDMSMDYSDLQNSYENERRAAADLRHAKEQEVEMVRDMDALLIGAMADGAAKQRAQAKLDYQRRLDQMDEWRSNYIENAKMMHKAQWIADNPGRDIREYNPSSFNPVPVIEAMDSAESAMRKLYEQQYRRMMADIAFEEQQSMAASYGTYGQKQAALGSKWRRELANVPKAYSDRAKAVRDYEFATLDYETISRYGSRDAVREALEKQLDAEIKTLDDAEKKAAEARKRVTLAEFDAETAEQYGTRGERRSALAARLSAELEEFVARNGEAKRAIAEAQNEYELANFDFEEIVDYGKYDEVLSKLREKWQKFIATLPDDLREGATAKMEEEIFELQRKHDETYKKIFSDINTMSRGMLDNTISLAESELRRLIDAGNTSADVLASLRTRIDQMREARDKIDFAGWGGSVTDVYRVEQERQRARQRTDSIWAEMEGIDQLTERYSKLKSELEQADDAENRLEEDAERAKFSLALSQTGEALSAIGSALSDISAASGNSSLSKAAKEFSEMGNAVSKIAAGFASGGETGGLVAAIETASGALVKFFTNVVAGNARWKKSLEELQEQYDLLAYKVDDDKYSNIFGTDGFSRAADAYSKAQSALAAFKEESDALRKSDFNKKDTSLPWYLSGGAFGIFGWIGKLFKDKESYSNVDIWGDDGYLDVDKAKAFLNVAENLTDEQRKQVEHAIAMKEAYDDAMASVQSYVSSLFGDAVGSLTDEMFENFLNTGDAILDLTGDMDAFTESIAKSVVQSRLLESVFNKTATDNMVNMIATGDVSGAINLFKQLKEQANALTPEINEFLNGIGVDWEGARDAATRSSLGASQDSIDESNGRLTAIQGHTFEINENVRVIKEQNNALLEHASGILNEIMGIHIDTSNMDKILSEMRGYVSEMRSNVGTIVDRGVTML